MDLIQLPERQQQLAILDHNPEDDYDYGHTDDEEPDEEPCDGDQAPQDEEVSIIEASQPEPMLQDSQGQPELLENELPDDSQDTQDVATLAAPDSPKHHATESPALASSSMPPPPVPIHRLHRQQQDEQGHRKEEILAKMAAVRFGVFGVLAGSFISLAISTFPFQRWQHIIAIKRGLKVSLLVLIVGWKSNVFSKP